LNSSTKDYDGKTHYIGSRNSDTTVLSGRELYHFQFSRQAASPETFGYILVLVNFTVLGTTKLFSVLCSLNPHKENQVLKIKLLTITDI
jgi:hypothetical protein